ncbi:Phosphate carrier protein, mitochondrial [Microtus ochrogaster]|uniref:Solute carrier family 25 member 3 n=1 Tax=Microtus ochrogaster TaxID=79684 RepID=A0A8J6KMS7_MICOH|nr:Phosphate carrier protein, mitochondrial [Microtus ochrogaster]
MFSSVAHLAQANPFNAPHLQLVHDGLSGPCSPQGPTTYPPPPWKIKCRMQVDPQKYKGIFNGFSVTLKEDGVRGLAKGWAPTFIGYASSGFTKSSKPCTATCLMRKTPICGAHHYI